MLVVGLEVTEGLQIRERCAVEGIIGGRGGVGLISVNSNTWVPSRVAPVAGTGRTEHPDTLYRLTSLA